MHYEHEPTIGLLEFASIARGIESADRLLKEALVRVLISRPVSPGKYVVLFTGAVEDVTSSLRVGAEVGGDALVDELFLPAVHEQVLAALDRPLVYADLVEALGIVETTTVASTLLAADAAAKRSDVRLIEIRLAQGIGGKSYVTLTGAVGDVESAVDAGARLAEDRGFLVARVVIAQVHPELRAALESHERPI